MTLLTGLTDKQLALAIPLEKRRKLNQWYSEATEDPTDYGTGRTCKASECPTVLTRYNPGPNCYRHEEVDLP